MESPYSTTFSKAILTSLFSGFIATLVCMGFYIYFKESTGFPLSALINVSSLIFFVNTLFLLIGFIYYGFTRFFKKGDALYIPVFILLTLFFIWKATGIHRSDDQVINIEFHHLLIGLYIIMGIAAVVGIPVLFHNKKFEEHVV